MRSSLLTLLGLLAVFGCGDDIGATIRAADSCRMLADAVRMRRTTLRCADIQLNCDTSGGCSDSDTATCVQRINAAGTCDSINTTYAECPIRCRR